MAAARATVADLDDRLAAWRVRAAKAGVDGLQPDQAAYFAAHIACPLLDVTAGRCLVYEVRPLGCRAHFVRGDPANCALPASVRPNMQIGHVESVAAARRIALEIGNGSGFAHLLAAWTSPRTES